MKTLLIQSLRAAVGVLVVLSLCIVLADDARQLAVPQHVQAAVLVLALSAIVFALLFRRVRSEDRIARLEAALCREQNARSQADMALIEADRLLDRLTARADGRGKNGPGAQLAVIQAELLQIRQQYVRDDPALAVRIDLLCTRVDGVAQAIGAARIIEPG